MLTPGTHLGPYEITAALGEGGMGEVYRAKDTRLNRDVAIKVLPTSFADDPDRRARFEREAQAVAALSHPNVIAIFDTGVHGGQLYVVMELLRRCGASRSISACGRRGERVREPSRGSAWGWGPTRNKK